MSIFTIISLVLMFIALSTFTFNLKAAKLCTDCYYPNKKVIKLIYDYNTSSAKFIAMRLEMADALGIKLRPRDKKMSWFTRLIIVLYQPLFKRIGLEQSSVNNWFIDKPSNKDVELKLAQLTDFYKFLSGLADIDLADKPHTELEKLYVINYTVNCFRAAYGVTDLESIINKPIIDKMFSKIDKKRLISRETIKGIEDTIKISKSHGKPAKIRYEISLMLKAIPFLHPILRTSPKYKLFTNN